MMALLSPLAEGGQRLLGQLRETLHGWWTLETLELTASNLSLKLYHLRELQPDH